MFISRNVLPLHWTANTGNWLPVRQLVVLKVAGLVHQSLDGVVPAYLIDDCRPLSDAGRPALRSSSSDNRTLVVPRTHNRFGEISFFGCRSTSLEWPSTWSTTAWTVICDFQTTTEDLFVQRPQCIDSYCRIICAIQILFMYVCICNYNTIQQHLMLPGV